MQPFDISKFLLFDIKYYRLNRIDKEESNFKIENALKNYEQNIKGLEINNALNLLMDEIELKDIVYPRNKLAKHIKAIEDGKESRLDKKEKYIFKTIFGSEPLCSLYHDLILYKGVNCYKSIITAYGIKFRILGVEQIKEEDIFSLNSFFYLFKLNDLCTDDIIRIYTENRRDILICEVQNYWSKTLLDVYDQLKNKDNVEHQLIVRVYAEAQKKYNIECIKEKDYNYLNILFLVFDLIEKSIDNIIILFEQIKFDLLLNEVNK